MSKNILLTGRPGIGKTTIIQRIVTNLSVPAGGFYTQEIREGGTRMGFRIISLDGREGLLAHKQKKSSFRVGPYGVNIEDIEGIGVRALEEALENSGCIVIDEIGSMELFSEAFQQCVLRCLDAPTPVLGTIQKKKTPFLNSIRSRQDVNLIEVTAANRDDVPSTIPEMIQQGLSNAPQSP